MHSSEKHVTSDSDFYIYEPSTLARDVYLYPLSSGHFRYTPGYRNQRRSFDSYELFYVEEGSVELKSHSRTFLATAGQFVLLDCYSPHSYYSKDGWACYWLHYDGLVAGAFYRRIVDAWGGFLFDLNQYSPAYQHLMNIYELFRRSRPVDEAGISSSITSILNAILSSAPRKQENVPVREAVASAVAYINERFRYPISLQDLAEHSAISPYYFTRVFHRETGFTPHQYIINTRLSNAKFLLRTTEDSVKNIAIQTGWSSESTFCSAFRKSVGMTPSLYRKRNLYDTQQSI
jgi:AraC-like DNA-binding protein